MQCSARHVLGKRSLPAVHFSPRSMAPLRARSIAKSIGSRHWNNPSQKLCPWPLTSIKVTEFPPPAVRNRARNAAEFSLSRTTCIGINRSGFPHGGPRLRRWMSP
jgi:hypothetical protein